MKIFTAKTDANIAKITAKLVGQSIKNPFDKCYVFCEDKNTLSIETEIANRLGGTFNVTVSSFSRYVLKRAKLENILSKSGSSLTVYKLMNMLSEKLLRLRINNRPTLAMSVYELIAQLKSAKVKPNDILQICESEKDGAFGSKLKDVYTVYNEYEKHLDDNKLIDSAYILDLLPKIVASDTELVGAKVIFTGISSMTRQIADAFSAFSFVADCDFVVLKGDGEFFTNEIYAKICQMFPKAETVKDNCNYLKEALVIERGLFAPIKNQESGLYDDKIRILECSTPFNEAHTVAKRIRLEVVKNKCRYKNFVIATNDLKTYGRVFREIFKDYEIPLYVDEKRTMEDHPYTRLVCCLLQAVKTDCAIDDVLLLSKQRVLFDESDAIKFEQYIKRNAISRKTFLKPFEIIEEGDKACESMRKRILYLCSLLKKKMSASAYSMELKTIFNEDMLQKRMQQLEIVLSEVENELQKFSQKAQAKIFQILDETEKIIGDRVLTAVEYKTVFLSATVATEISILPLYNDMVYLGDYKSAKQRQADVLFMVGLTADVPNAKQDTALLNDRDLIKMEGYKCVVEPKIQIVNKRERENFGVSMMSFDRKLFLLYPRMDLSGQMISKSVAVDDICKIFGLTPKDIDAAKAAGVYDSGKDIYGYMTVKAGMKQFALDVNAFCERMPEATPVMNAFYSAVKDKYLNEVERILNKKAVTKLDGEVCDRLSASLIESYFACPYSCFAKYNLKLQEDETGDAQSFEYGTMLHAVLEKFVKNINSVKSREQSRQLAEKLFDETIKERVYARYLNKSRYEHIFSLVKKEIGKRASDVFSEFENSNFKPIGEEVAFGRMPNAKLPAIEIETKKGKKIISGMVDRVDRFKDYIRIVDYKTGNPENKIKAEKLYSGNSIQLYLYSNAFLSGIDKLAGVYYYRVDDSFKELGAENRPFIGRTLYDEEIVKNTDLRLNNDDKSQTYNLSFKTPKNGERTLAKSEAMLTEKELEAFVGYAKKIVKSGADELGEGNIVASPYDGACDYCKLKGMCGYDDEVEMRTRAVDKIEPEDIIKIMEDEQ